MDNGWMKDVAEFHRAFDVPVRTVPQIPSEIERQLRWDLITEEVSELGEAWQSDDLVDIADALADLIYVAIGMALTYGIPLHHVWDEVQRSNMDKLGGGRREDGKILKPANWEPPKIRECLRQYGLID
jgi:predicted HAD superfamily Cof-like phosphohydrolase